MSLSIRLLGSPALERDGSSVPAPRGRKSWGLLAYLVLSRNPPSRRELAELLFGDADDPLGALRWSLSQIRRAISPEAELGGDPVRLELGTEVALDIALLDASSIDPADADRLSAELLDGMAFSGAPAFESWLLVERRRLAGTAVAALHETALAHLAASDHDAATDLARRTVALDPLDESNQELLVRCLSAGGDGPAALAQAEACEQLFRSELGIDPSPAVRRAVDWPEPFKRGTQGRPAAARGMLEAGQAAITAGATEAGITSLREACAEAARCRDPALRAETLTALGIALVHSVRGWDEEGAASLHRALVLADEAGTRQIAATAHRELGWIGVVAGRREQSRSHLERAAELAEGEDEIAAVLGVRGMHSSDTAEYQTAIETLQESLERAAVAGDRRQTAFSGTVLARAQLLRGELDEAERRAEAAIEDARSERWLAFIPWPETLRAEVDRMRGFDEAAEERFQHAFTLACEIQDPCWEAFAARGIGLIAAGRGNPQAAGRWLEEARTRCTRWPDRYEWAHAWVLDAAAGLAVEREDVRAKELAGRLEENASRATLRELVARALIHRARLGDLDASGAAELIGREIDNPLLQAELSAPAS
jgi:DNA-binding SARP family transcriptional activator/osmotically-inducible protein OsmY